MVRDVDDIRLPSSLMSQLIHIPIFLLKYAYIMSRVISCVCIWPQI